MYYDEEPAQFVTWRKGRIVGYNEGYSEGAAVAFGLMGMAEAIRAQRFFVCDACDAETVSSHGHLCDACSSIISMVIGLRYP